jgi:hypothetical protein
MTSTADLHLHKLRTPPPARGGVWRGHKPGVRLSELGGCNRKQTLRLLGAKAEPITDRQRAIFEAGKVWEAYIRDLWRDALGPGAVACGVPVKTPFGMGEIDLFIPGMSRIIEIKTSTSKSRDYLPNEGNVAQLLLYLHFYGIEELGLRVNEISGELVYVLKDTGEVVSCPVGYDHAKVNALIRDAGLITKAVAKRENLPIPMNYRPDRFPCGWQDGRCQYFRECW